MCDVVYKNCIQYIYREASEMTMIERNRIEGDRKRDRGAEQQTDDV